MAKHIHIHFGDTRRKAVDAAKVRVIRAYATSSGFQVPVGVYESEGRSGQTFIKVRGDWVPVAGNNFEFTGTRDAGAGDKEHYLDWCSKRSKNPDNAGTLREYCNLFGISVTAENQIRKQLGVKDATVVRRLDMSQDAWKSLMRRKDPLATFKEEGKQVKAFDRKGEHIGTWIDSTEGA